LALVSRNFVVVEVEEGEEIMDDARRLGNEKAMNASIDWAAKEAARAPAVYPDNCIVRFGSADVDGKVVGVDQRKPTDPGEKTSFIPSRN
jgi:hypothetical protein